MTRSRIVVIGAGHSGLVAAAYLAKAGHPVTVLERADALGGILRGGELAPGFRAPGIAHTVGRLRASVIQELRLERHGLELRAPEARLFAPLPDGGSVTFWSDPARTAEELRARSPHDAAAFAPFDRKVRAIGGLLDRVHRMTFCRRPSRTRACAGRSPRGASCSPRWGRGRPARRRCS
jgi:phytoene dehydrogenase-like protein